MIIRFENMQIRSYINVARYNWLKQKVYEIKQIETKQILVKCVYLHMHDLLCK
jgi:hypothetical protein